MSELLVTKADGTREPFSEEKLRNAFKRADLPESEYDGIVAKVKSLLHEKVTTVEIGNWVSRFLEEERPELTGKYYLKRAVMELGPTGYPFEQFVARLLQAYDYETETDLMMPGLCVNHEVDVLAMKGKREFFVECKYHNLPGVRSDIKTALYVKARRDDLSQRRQKDNPDKEYNSWIFTNTKFSQDAIVYAQCTGLRLTGWNYPEDNNLQAMIEKNKLYPITCLTSLTPEEKSVLLSHQLVLVKDVFANLKSVYELCNIEHHRRRVLEAEGEIYS